MFCGHPSATHWVSPLSVPYRQHLQSLSFIRFSSPILASTNTSPQHSDMLSLTFMALDYLTLTGNKVLVDCAYSWNKQILVLLKALLFGPCLSSFCWSLGHTTTSFHYHMRKFLAMDCWLTTLWRFFDLAQLQLQPMLPVILPPLSPAWWVHYWRCFLTNLPKPSILAINWCHIAHQAMYWSNVANGWGDSISPSSLQPPTTPMQRPWTWPPEKPLHSNSTIWLAFLKDSPHTSGSSFILLLGPWVQSTHHLDFVPFNLQSQVVFMQGQEQCWRHSHPIHPTLPYHKNLPLPICHSVPSTYWSLGPDQKPPHPLPSIVRLSSFVPLVSGSI